MAKKDLRKFDPDKLARFDTDMWRAYYSHHFLRLFVLLLQLMRSYFQPSYILTIRAAYHSAAAAVIFRKTKGREDSERVREHLVQFYRLLSNHNAQAFDYTKAAELELQWWLVDRYPERYKASRPVVLAQTMAVVYNVPAKSLEAYGHKRAEAMLLIGDHHHNIAATPDWEKIKILLSESYWALYHIVNGRRK